MDPNPPGSVFSRDMMENMFIRIRFLYRRSDTDPYFQTVKPKTMLLKKKYPLGKRCMNVVIIEVNSRQLYSS